MALSPRSASAAASARSDAVARRGTPVPAFATSAPPRETAPAAPAVFDAAVEPTAAPPVIALATQPPAEPAPQPVHVRNLRWQATQAASDGLPRPRMTRVSALPVQSNAARPPVVETGANPDGVSAGAALVVASPRPAPASPGPAAISPTAVPLDHSAGAAPAISVAPSPPATATPPAARPAPTRTAVLAAFQSAARPAAPAAAALALPAPVVAPPAPAPLAIALMSHMSPAPLSRVQTAVSAAPNGDRSPVQPGEGSPDLDALADYVLERLRGELRDGRERLGFLLDDSH